MLLRRVSDTLSGLASFHDSSRHPHEHKEAMELKGRIVHVLPEKSGTSARGVWRKQEYVIEIPGEYPKKVCFMVWGDKIDQFQIQQGQELTVHFDLESREYNERWYTDVKGWKVERGEHQVDDAPHPVETDEPPPIEDDDIPF